MNELILQMLAKYPANSLYEKKNALREIIQEMALCGLARAGFFKHTAFYGGTALRIFYGLDRFSEDLDFSLTEITPGFELKPFFPVLEKELHAFGLNMEVQEKEKPSDARIQSAFLKGNTKEQLLLVFGDEPLAGIHAGEKIKIKFEVDTDPPAYAGFEHRYRMLPAPYEIQLYDAPSLFAGKLHAILCRNWQSRVKGRDLYDYVFLLSRGIPVKLAHLQARLAQNACLDLGETLSREKLKEALVQRFERINYRLAREDAAPFVRDAQALAVWSPAFFIEITDELKAQ